MGDHDLLCIYDDSYGSLCEICRALQEARADERAAIMARVAKDMSLESGQWIRLARSTGWADLRVKVKALRPASVIGSDEALIDARADGWDEAINAVLDLIDGSDHE